MRDFIGGVEGRILDRPASIYRTSPAAS